ncbi:carbohydrate ABC transporter permease [Ktedonobacter racemifer]|uniref:Binding-protein-dependent transport systems inner membrane component n=1 Tax=Ktedonobacter racemifer DSM 44963 TaxID=485913 RepID=D6TBS1_KTERA|nr:carbohydrate ABC transporter permease [Ktedonobacter racemifer]EFH89853.1 binding-protein-dependent transport systems inner membrane component [Ktedonobacter racemifer DSM 44963]
MSQQTVPVPIPAARERVDARRQRPRRSNLESIVAMTLLSLFGVYFLVPYFWLIVSSTKDAGDLFGTFGFWFAPNFNLFSNLQQLFTYQDGIYTRWLLNTLLYAGVGALVSTWLAAMAGYALAKYVFRGRNLMFSLILGAILVPVTALALPLYLLMSGVGLTNTYWAVLLPSCVSPFGVYLSRIYAATAVPDELLEAARIDGAGEFRAFTMAVNLMIPALVTVFLFQFVAIWNNYFLPLVMLSDEKLFPITVGLQTWNVTTGGVTKFLYGLIITGALISSLPLLAGCVALQRFWRGGLGAGSVKG